MFLSWTASHRTFCTVRNACILLDGGYIFPVVAWSYFIPTDRSDLPFAFLVVMQHEPQPNISPLAVTNVLTWAMDEVWQMSAICQACISTPRRITLSPEESLPAWGFEDDSKRIWAECAITDKDVYEVLVAEYYIWKPRFLSSPKPSNSAQSWVLSMPR